MKTYRMAATGAIAALAILVSAPASAQNITYLECTMPNGAEQVIWKIALDEQAKLVTFEHPLASGSRPAIFTADKVTWNEGRLSIRRVDLRFTRTFLDKSDVGQCKVVRPPKRAF